MTSGISLSQNDKPPFGFPFQKCFAVRWTKPQYVWEKRHEVRNGDCFVDQQFSHDGNFGCRKPSAFAELVRCYERAAIITAYSVLKDFHLAQDAAQEAFVIAYQRLGHPPRFLYRSQPGLHLHQVGVVGKIGRQVGKRARVRVAGPQEVTRGPMVRYQRASDDLWEPPAKDKRL